MNETADNKITNPRDSLEDSFQDICERRLTRRGFVKMGALVGATTAALQLSGCGDNSVEEQTQEELSWRDNNPYISNYDFIEIEHGGDEHHHVAPDHEAKVLLRWGDPLFKNSPEFDPDNQSAEAQKLQFGYNLSLIHI